MKDVEQTGHKQDMNNDELDARLRSASAPDDRVTNPEILAQSVVSRRRPVHQWLNTTTGSTRSTATGLVGAVAILALAIPVLGPTNSSLFTVSGDARYSANSTAAGESLSGDAKMMMPFAIYNYVAGDSLSNNSGTGHVYRFELNGDAQSRAREVARVLGVTGEPTKASYFDEAYPTWVVGPEDGTKPNVVVMWTGTGNWWYNNPAAYPELMCVDPGQPGEVAGDEQSLECSEYAEGVTGKNPSAGEAKASAFEVFSRLGYDGTSSSLTVYRDEWSTTVTAPVEADGQPIAVDWSMSWASNGEIAYVGGHSATLVDAGLFDTISEKSAVERLDDWRWYGAAPMTGNPLISARSYAATEDIVDEGSTVGGDGDSDVDSGDDAPDVEPTAEPTAEPTEMPVTPEPTEAPVTPEPIPTPTILEVIINSAKHQMLVVWDSNGGAWLVPGFVMSGNEGWPMAVISLVEGVIELPEPLPIEPAITY